jgi:methanethiol S-methyltransferase
MGSMIVRVFIALGLFGGVHSLLAARPVKKWAERQFGQRQRNGLYRPFYLLQSAVTLAILLAYLSRLPDQLIYHVRGPQAALMRLCQAGGLIFATAAATQVGVSRILGLRSLLAWLQGAEYVPAEPEAQGPSPDEDHPGQLRVRGPFTVSRHPLNLAPLPVFWLTPRMTAKRLAFNLAATAYMVIGSLHEESRLRQAYGKVYAAYQHSGIPFYIGIRKNR